MCVCVCGVYGKCLCEEMTLTLQRFLKFIDARNWVISFSDIDKKLLLLCVNLKIDFLFIFLKGLKIKFWKGCSEPRASIEEIKAIQFLGEVTLWGARQFRSFMLHCIAHYPNTILSHIKD